jgi:GAF domain-containing protein
VNEEAKQRAYDLVIPRIEALIAGERDAIAIMATAVCELHHGFEHFDWTGFYRVVEPDLLKIGPYQGTHGCLEVPFERGVCGAAARLGQTQVVPDVQEFPGHIACSESTRSEIVVPVLTPQGQLVAVLDVDSNQPGAFADVDRVNLEHVCRMIGEVVGD